MKVFTSKHDSTLKLVFLDECQDRPILAAYGAMKQDYSAFPVYPMVPTWEKLTDDKIAERVLRRATQYGHFGVLEHMGGLVFNVVGFPHDTVMQHRTHRVGVSFDVMSQRYTGYHIVEAFSKKELTDDFVTKHFYFPPLGTQYKDRNGNVVEYTEKMKLDHVFRTRGSCCDYATDIIDCGIPPEAARRQLPQNIRQHYFFSCNLRSMMHIVGVRSTSDVQLEFRWLSELFLEAMQHIQPRLAKEFEIKRYRKNKLAP